MVRQRRGIIDCVSIQTGLIRSHRARRSWKSARGARRPAGRAERGFRTLVGRPILGFVARV